MTNPTRQEIISAHEALETLCARVPEETPTYALKSLILSAIPPRPNPTMAEITWDEDEHYLAEALHPKYGRVAMYCIGSTKEWIGIIHWDGEDVDYRNVGLGELEPTGKHYFRNDKN